jgi:hypothetical protein
MENRSIFAGRVVTMSASFKASPSGLLSCRRDSHPFLHSKSPGQGFYKIPCIIGFEICKEPYLPVVDPYDRNLVSQLLDSTQDRAVATDHDSHIRIGLPARVAGFSKTGSRILLKENCNSFFFQRVLHLPRTGNGAGQVNAGN